MQEPSLLSNLLPTYNTQDPDIWLNQNSTFPWICGGVYLILIYLGQRIMMTREALNLRKSMFLWNAGLAIFSIIGTYNTLPELVDIIGQHGLHASVCASNREVVSANGMLWKWIFALSKVVELGDTLFLVLKKRKVIFLHWYHHLTVLVYCWYGATSSLSTGRFFLVVNFGIHSLMYTYYALHSISFRIPKTIAMSITILQISQMILGVGIAIYAYVMSLKGNCSATLTQLQFSFVIYASYFALFAHFFYKAYSSSGGKKGEKKVQ